MKKETSRAKILLLDIETAPAIAYTWGLWGVNIGIDQIIKDGYILMWAAKWLGEKKIMWDSVARHSKSPEEYSSKGERDLVKSIWKLIDEADIVIAHNGDEFDLKWINGTFIKHHLPPTSTTKSIDTLKAARNAGRFISNKLDFLSRKFQLGTKVRTGGFDLWTNVMAGDTSAWKHMVFYCKHDVRLLEQIYLKLRPFIKTHPNLNAYRENNRTGCSVCPSIRVRRKGIWISAVGIKYQRYACLECGHNMRDRLAMKPIQKGLVNAL